MGMGWERVLGFFEYLIEDVVYCFEVVVEVEFVFELLC